MSIPGPVWLFCPGDRPERYTKALAAADAVIIDLEDAVADVDKDRARTALVECPVDPARVIVRVNPAVSGHRDADLEAVARTKYTRIMLPKVEDPRDLDGMDRWEVVALIETAQGVLCAPAIAAHSGVSAVMWGAEDLIASLDGKSSRDPSGRYRDVCRAARSQVLLSCGAAGTDAVDSVYLDIADVAGLAEESSDAVASGFTYKACIHPSHAEVIRKAFRPGDTEVAWARDVIDSGRGGGVSTVGGRMVDAPLIRQAEKILRNALPGQERRKNDVP